MDTAIRKVLGLPIPEGDHVLSTILLTEDNIVAPQNSYDVPADYDQQFLKLWQLA